MDISDGGCTLLYDYPDHYCKRILEMRVLNMYTYIFQRECSGIWNNMLKINFLQI